MYASFILQDYENDVRGMRSRQPCHQQQVASRQQCSVFSSLYLIYFVSQGWEESAGWETSSQSSSSAASTSTSKFVLNSLTLQSSLMLIFVLILASADWLSHRNF